MFRSERLKTTALITLLFSFSILNYNCKVDSTITEPTVAAIGSGTGTNLSSIITGQVINSLNGIPIDSALVQILNSSLSISTYTNTLGKFTDSVQLSSNTNFTIYVTKSGYQQDTIAVTINAGTNYSAGVVNLIPTSSSGQIPSGNPVSIFLFSQTATNIGVKATGSIETAGLTFEVLDSAGVPLDLNHTVNVNFFIEAQPNGGEFLSPSSVYTNDVGLATVNLTSGTKAGVVQIRAEIDLANGTVIISHPVAITIFGGLPDLNHFSVSSIIKNFPDPTLLDLWQDYKQDIKIFVGDKYANPVRPQTSVYLTSTGGYTQGSVLTDQMGTALADFVVANPYPVDPVLGPGWAIITASTADENKQTISANTVVYFSGDALLTNVSPTSFDVPNGGSQAFSYDVSDKYGNPLASGTNITVSVQGVNVGSEGDVRVSVPDTQDKSWTHFHFTIYDTNDTVNVANPCKVLIQVSSPNGNLNPYQINGITR